ncbi:MAG: hypothetical protein ABR562_09925, partial [Thermoplasmatota archaeon]
TYTAPREARSASTAAAAAHLARIRSAEPNQISGPLRSRAVRPWLPSLSDWTRPSSAGGAAPARPARAPSRR